MVEEKMCIGVVKDRLIVRIDTENEKTFLSKEGAQPMDFTR